MAIIPRQKYRNHAQLVQGVSQVRDSTLTQGERLFLLTLAVFNVKTDPHPGNEKLMLACGVTSRKGVNYIANKLITKKLIEILEVGNGRGKATVYRICVESEYFPWPETKGKPASSELRDTDGKPGSSDVPVSPVNPEAQTSHFPTGNPEVKKPKPGSDASETRKSGLPYGFKPPDTYTEGAVFECEGHARVGCTNTEPETGRVTEFPEQANSPPPAITIFWENYPTAKNYPSIPRGVRKAWREIDGDQHLGEILTGLKRWTKSDRWRDERYVKDPRNFLAEKVFLVSPPSNRSVKPAFDHTKLKRV